ncbi:MAG: leucine-rich repeat domain-containing protein [Ruminococcus sp.]|nr:leucine-rich repeat domain-containing protein [Ruminococcus sp.]
MVIPSEIEDLPVTEIGESAFTSITVNSVVVLESVTYIAENAFQFCDSLNEITILNPSCEIYVSRTMITNCYIYLVPGEDLEHFTGTIYGYADSTAQTYAKTYCYAFAVIEENTSTGALRIVDENDDVSADIESEIIAQYAAAYPGVDLSDFSLVFLADQSAIYMDYTSYYRFEMYYQDMYLLNRIVQVKVTAGGEVTASIMDESLINYCLTSLDSNYLSEEEILRYVCCEADDYILSDEPLSISLVVYTGYSDVTTSLTYAITYEHTDGERTFFLDAYTGMGLGWRSNWSDGIQYGWTGMMQLSYSKEDDGYIFTVESTYSDLDGWLTLADVDTGEDLAVDDRSGNDRGRILSLHLFYDIAFGYRYNQNVIRLYRAR